jgi:AcrR family transcriptional regulator
VGSAGKATSGISTPTLATLDVEQLEGTKQRILNAAVACLEQYGESGVRLRDIKERVGVHTGSIYHFFGSRDGLIAAAHAERYERSLTAVGSFPLLLDNSNSAAEFRAGVEMIFDVISSPDGVARRQQRLAAIAGLVDRPLLRTLLQAKHQAAEVEIQTIFEEAQRRGFIPESQNLRGVGGWYLGMLIGRVSLEEGLSNSSVAEWNDISRRTVLFLLFGECS